MSQSQEHVDLLTSDISLSSSSGAAQSCVQASEQFVPPGSVMRIGEDRGEETVYYDPNTVPGICYVWMKLLPEWEQKQIREEASAA